MIDDLTNSLRSLLEGSTGLESVTIALERPDDTYRPSNDTLNLFLYDVRENAELRSNEPVTERSEGRYIVRPAPARLACSYLVTAWSEHGDADDVGVLAQQRLLGTVLATLLARPVLPATELSGDLKNTRYPVSLMTARSDLVRDPAEFWSAIGGKLRPSVTVTATIAIEATVQAPSGALVSTSELRVRPPIYAPATVSEYAVDAPTAVPEYAIGGTVRSERDKSALDRAVLTLRETGRSAVSNANGQFVLSPLPAGSYTLMGSCKGFATVTRAIEVPGGTPNAFDVELPPSS